MGSLGTPPPISEDVQVQFHITGFGPFHLVPENPTQLLVKQFVSFCEERGGLHKAAIVKSTLVAVTSVQGAERVLEQVYSKLQRNKDIRNIIIHCGVDTCANCFRLEERAYNEASFRYPDESGWQPRSVPIDDTKPLDSYLVTGMNIRQLTEKMEKLGFRVKCSEDAGRFLCNWIYYKSLKRAQYEPTVKVLFVHFPPLAEPQAIYSYCEFLLELLNKITMEESG